MLSMGVDILYRVRPRVRPLVTWERLSLGWSARNTWKRQVSSSTSHRQRWYGFNRFHLAAPRGTCYQGVARDTEGVVHTKTLA